MNPAETATLARLLTGTDTNSYTNASLLLAVNFSYERITAKLVANTAAGKWPYGDINYSAFPTYTVNLTNSTARYEIDALSTPLTIMGVEVLDQDGNFHKLDPITLKEIHAKGFSQSEFFETDGQPLFYEKREHAIVLYPAPDNGVSVTLTAGLRIFFLRTASVITDITDTTTDLGLPSPYMDIPAYEAAYLFAVAKGLANANFLKSEVDRKEKELMDFIAKRNPDDEKAIRSKRINFR